MNENKYSPKMSTKSDSMLTYYLNNKHQFPEDEVLAAKWELEKRGLFEEKHEHTTDSDSPVEFPPKPIEETGNQSIYRSLISLGLFIGLFYLVFDWSFLYILVLAGILLIHELGHYAAMRRFNYTDLGIFFIPMLGAVATGRKEKISQRQQVIILLAGPLPGIIIGTIIYYFGMRDQNEFLTRTANLFIFLNLFNLIPVMPLDGGRLLKTLFFENNEMISKAFLFLSMAALIYYSLTAQSYFLLIIPVFLFIQISAQSQFKRAKKEAENQGIDLDKSYEELTDEEYWRIRDVLGTHTKIFQGSFTPKEYVPAADENKIIKHVKSIIQKKPEKDLSPFNKILITALWLLSFVIPFLVIIAYSIILDTDIT